MNPVQFRDFRFCGRRVTPPQVRDPEKRAVGIWHLVDRRVRPAERGGCPMNCLT